MTKVTMELTKDQLQTVATERGVEFKKAWNKTQLVEAINSVVVEEVKEEVLTTEPQTQQIILPGFKGLSTLAGTSIKVEEKKVSPTPQPVKEEVVLPGFEEMKSRIAKGLFVVNKNRTVALRITAVSTDLKVYSGYQFIHKDLEVKPTFKVTDRAIKAGEFVFVSTSEVKAIIDTITAKKNKPTPQPIKETSNNRYLVDVDRTTGEAAVIDRKDGSVYTPSYGTYYKKAMNITGYTHPELANKIMQEGTFGERLAAKLAKYSK